MFRMFAVPSLVVLAAYAAHPTIEIAPGVHMPIPTLGTSQFHGQDALNQIKLARELGYVSIDTAHGYPPDDPAYDQAAVGQALANASRDSFFLITKIPGGYTKADTKLLLEDDMKILGMDYVDLMLIHHPVSIKPNWRQNYSLPLDKTVQLQWEALEEFYAAGKARAIGVSNFCPKVLDMLLETATVKPAVNQVLFHAGLGYDPDHVFSHSTALNITVQAFSSIDQANPALVSGEPYHSIGLKYNKSGLQVGLRWLVQHDPPISYVAASGKANHLTANQDVFDFELTAEEMDAVSSQHHCRAGGTCLPYWPGSEGCNQCCCPYSPAGYCCCTTTSTTTNSTSTTAPMRLMNLISV